MSRWMGYGLMSWVIVCSHVPVWADEAEDRAIIFVEKSFGFVIRDEEARGKPVVTVLLDRPAQKEVELKELAPFVKLTNLDLTDVEVTEAGVVELAQFKNLTRLTLSGRHVTDAALSKFRQEMPRCLIRHNLSAGRKLFSD